MSTEISPSVATWWKITGSTVYRRIQLAGFMEFAAFSVNSLIRHRPSEISEVAQPVFQCGQNISLPSKEMMGNDCAQGSTGLVDYQLRVRGEVV